MDSFVELSRTTTRAANLLLAGQQKEAYRLFAQVERIVTVVVANIEQLSPEQARAFNEYKFDAYSEARSIFNGYGIKKRGG